MNNSAIWAKAAARAREYYSLLELVEREETLQQKEQTHEPKGCFGRFGLKRN
jgi:hypothetical protein